MLLGMISDKIGTAFGHSHATDMFGVQTKELGSNIVHHGDFLSPQERTAKSQVHIPRLGLPNGLPALCAAPQGLGVARRPAPAVLSSHCQPVTHQTTKQSR